ncbi:DUF4058 family protein [Dolichospermum circinale CS-537/01]|uniref:DUF4058 family protein n=1 Tax=Dolichospermum circinale CS-537/01 TaxID=3021739 RepID=A0ABT5A7M9_9CYAN|nr:DUF4058 family protein [Dolichospermum circinale]MDB9487959.1 DUF4058 family protein [Dolichospermum circinale CS-537/01]
MQDPFPGMNPYLEQPEFLGENEPVIDLNRLLNEIYERARFDLAIDYSQVAKPALSSE